MQATICYGQKSVQTDEQKIITWIQDNAIPLLHVEAGNDFSDLHSL